MKRFLITTALEETWTEGEPVLFLGEWCRLFERRAHWSTLDAALLPYHWDDRAKLYADYQYLRELHEHLLVKLSWQLNTIHGVGHSVRYWRILVGPWLGYFVQMLFDRWSCVQQAVRQFDISRTVLLVGGEEDLVPRDMADFTRLYLGDEWNHHIYGAILRRFTTVAVNEMARQHAQESHRGESRSMSFGRRTKRTLAAWFSVATSGLTRERDAFLMHTYLPFLDEIRLNRRLGQVPQLWRGVPTTHTDVDWSQREWTLKGECHREFEIAAHELIPQQIPTAYLEGYSRLVEQTAGLPWPKAPRVVWTSNAHNADDVFKAWAAAKVEQGSPLLIGQHGGHFGIGRWSFVEEHDIAISSRYLSWGWAEPAQPKLLPLGQVKGKRPLGVRHAKQSRALLVTCTFPRYSYWMSSVVVAGQYLQYLDDQYAFVEALPARIRKQLVVRLYAGPPCWSPELRWRDRFPDLKLDNGRAPINELIRRSRLYISTYNATTFLESFTMNVPTIIFWNPAHWELRGSAMPFFDELKEVGIFHETPASAAIHVAGIWDDVDAWWQSPAVRTAVDRFTERFSYLPTDLSDRLERELRKASEPRTERVAH